MGMTYTICYCISPLRKCKSRFGEKTKEEIIDKQHWEETRENLTRYLADEVCVPGTTAAVQVPTEAIGLLNDYTTWIREVDQLNTLDAAACLRALSHGNELASRIAYLVHRIAATPLENGKLKTNSALRNSSSEALSIPTRLPEHTLHVEIADLLVRSIHRALFELVESKRSGDRAYVFHHLALAVDGVTELFRLTTEAIGHIGSERLLSAEHPHYRSLESRWDEDGI